MNGRGFITISMHELERVKIIEAVVQHRQTIVLAAERLQLCERQVSRLVRRYEAAGPAGLVSARRGQPSNRELPVDVVNATRNFPRSIEVKIPTLCNR
jgi:hypothetical protein